MSRFVSSPETFFVEEIPAYLPAGEGEHTYVWIEKRNLTTLDAVGKLGSAGTFTADQIAQFLGGTSRLVGNTGAPPESLGPGPANAATTQELPQPAGRTVAEEEEALASIAQEYGILDYHVFQTEARITGASVNFRRWEISFTADAE